MKRNKLFQSLKNSFFSFGTFGLTGLVGFIITPYIIDKISEYQFGLFRLVLELKMYLALCELGLSVSSSHFLAKAISTGERESIIHVVKKTLFTSIKIFPLTLIGTIILYFFLPEEVQISRWKLDVVFFAIMGTAFIYQPTNVLIECLRADEREDIVSISSFLQLIMMSTFSILFIHLGLDILSLGIAHLLAALLFATIITIYAISVIRSYPKLKKQSFTLNDKELWTHNKYAFLNTLASNLTHFSDNLILSKVMGVSALTPFYINHRLPQVCQQVCQALGGSSWAALIKIYFNKDYDNFRDKFSLTYKFILFASFSTLITIYLHNQSFISLWMGEKYLLSDFFNLIVCLMPIGFAINSFWHFLIVGSGNLNKVVPWVLACSVLNFILSIVFTYQFGSVGVILGTFVSIIVGYLWVSIFFLKKIFKLKLSTLVNPLVKASIICFIFVYLYQKSPLVNLSKETFLELFISLGITFVFLSIPSFFIIFNISEISAVMTRLKPLLSFFKKD